MTDLRLNIIWSILLSAALTWWLGQGQADGQSALVTAGIVLSLSVVRAGRIIPDFMGCATTRACGGYLMLAWIIAMAVLLFAASFGTACAAIVFLTKFKVFSFLKMKIKVFF